MSDVEPSIADLRLIALEGERSYEELPVMREVAIRVKVNVLPSDDDGAGDGRRLSTILATLLLEVFGVDDDHAEAPSSEEAVSSEATGAVPRSPVYSSRVTFRIDADRPAGEDPEWVPAVFAEAWPYLRSQVMSHALLLGMGRIPVPLQAPDNLAREPQPGEA